LEGSQALSFFEQMRLVAFDPQEGVAAFFHNRLAQFALAVQGVGADKLAPSCGNAN